VADALMEEVTGTIAVLVVYGTIEKDMVEIIQEGLSEFVGQGVTVIA
jgi:hypothetical protein